MELKKATIDELVAELLARPAFQGLVAWQSTGVGPKGGWRWEARNLDPRPACEAILKDIKGGG